MTSDSESVKDKTVQNLTEFKCGICGPSTCNEVMVGCNGCLGLFHTRCVGIVEERLPKRWYCQSKDCQHKAQEYRKQKKQSRSCKQTDEFQEFSINSNLGASSVEAKVRAMEERQKRKMEDLEVEMQLQRKEKELQRTYEKKLMALELQMSAEEEEEELAWQEKMFRKKAEQIKRMKANQESFEERMADMDEKLAELLDLKVPKPASKYTADVLRVESSSKINQNALQLTKVNVEKFVKDVDSTEEEEDNDKYSEIWESSKSSLEKKAKNNVSRRIKKKVDNLSQNGLGRQQTGPTKAQLAARKGLTYKLPKFSGNPAQWPLFYAAYKASNDACGYMHHENLMRLQEALEGDALELVFGQLLLPETIPRVIEKLRRHYGRPEQLLESLLDKVDRLNPPQPDNLGSFVPFGNTVEQLCDHLEAAELHQHLVNPLLIKSLVAKLPDREKREWVRYRRGRGETTLRTLTDFLMNIVEDACEANVDVEFMQSREAPRIFQPGTSMPEKGAVYFHSMTSSLPIDTKEKILKPCNLCRRTDHRLRHCTDFKNMRYVDRLELANCEKLCHVCLNEHGGKCKFKIRCNIGECKEFHNPLMHPVENVIGRSAHIRTNCTVLFQIVPVKLHCGEKSATVLAFLDEGSSVTLVEKKLADRLGADGVQERLTIRWTGNVSRVEDTRRMSLWASGASANAGDKMLLHTVHTVGKLMLPHQELDFEGLAVECPHMQGLPIESYDGQPQLLIGANNIHSFAPIEARVGNSMEPIAVRTNLGWTVYGPRQSSTVAASNYLGYHQQVAHENLQELIKNPYALEESLMAMSQESAGKKRIRDILERSTKREGDRFKTGLKRAADNLDNPDIYPIALPCIKQPEKRLEKNRKQIDKQQQKSEAGGFGYQHKAFDLPEDLRFVNVENPMYFSRDKRESKRNVLRVIWKPNVDQLAFFTTQGEKLTPYMRESRRPTKKHDASNDPPRMQPPLTIHSKTVQQKIDITDAWAKWDQDSPLKSVRGSVMSSVVGFVTKCRRKRRGEPIIIQATIEQQMYKAQWNSCLEGIGSGNLQRRPDEPAAIIKSTWIHNDPTAHGKNRKSWKRDTVEASIQDSDERVQQAAMRTDYVKALKRGGESDSNKGKVNPEMPDVTGGGVAMRLEQTCRMNRSSREQKHNMTVQAVTVVDMEREKKTKHRWMKNTLSR